MPLKWNRGVNPYALNHYGLLGVGPTLPYKKITAVAQDLCRRIEGGRSPQVAGQSLTVFQVNEASAKLADGRNRATELLLVHPELRSSEDRLGQVVTQLRAAAVWPEERMPLPLTHPLALFRLLPPPRPEAAPLPPWEAFGFVQASDAEDLALDIVFDV